MKLAPWTSRVPSPFRRLGGRFTAECFAKRPSVVLGTWMLDLDLGFGVLPLGPWGPCSLSYFPCRKAKEQQEGRHDIESRVRLQVVCCQHVLGTLFEVIKGSPKKAPHETENPKPLGVQAFFLSNRK